MTNKTFQNTCAYFYAKMFYALFIAIGVEKALRSCTYLYPSLKTLFKNSMSIFYLKSGELILFKTNEALFFLEEIGVT